MYDTSEFFFFGAWRTYAWKFHDWLNFRFSLCVCTFTTCEQCAEIKDNFTSGFSISNIDTLAHFHRRWLTCLYCPRQSGQIILEPWHDEKIHVPKLSLRHLSFMLFLGYMWGANTYQSWFFKLGPGDNRYLLFPSSLFESSSGVIIFLFYEEKSLVIVRSCNISWGSF